MFSKPHEALGSIHPDILPRALTSLKILLRGSMPKLREHSPPAVMEAMLLCAVHELGLKMVTGEKEATIHLSYYSEAQLH